jgi:diguanylate cyclase (GGDEF)-like protein
MDKATASPQVSSVETGSGLDEVLAAAARGVCEALKADASLIGLAENDRVLFRASHNLPKKVLADHRLTRDAPLEGIVFRTGEPYVSEVLTDHPGYADSLASRLGVRSGLMVPLQSRSDVIGCLYIGNFTERRFTDDDIRVACVFAQQLAVAVANASLLERERGEHQRSQILLELVRAAGSTLTLKQVLTQVCEAVARLSVGDRCSILLVDRAGGTLETLMSIGSTNEEMWQRARAMAGAPVGLAPGMRDAFLAQKPIFIGHANRTRLIPQRIVKALGIKSLAIYPMVARDQVVGIMAVVSVKKYLRFPEEEIETMTAIARQAAVLIDNARLFEQEQKQRQRAEALLQIVGATSSSLSLKKVLIKLCQSVVDFSVGDRCSFFLVEEGKERATPTMSLGIEDPSLWEKFKGSSALKQSQIHGIREAFQAQEPVIEEHVPGSGLLPDYWVDTFNVKSVALYPLVHREKNVGVMAVDSFRDFVHFPPEEVETMTAIAGQAAVVIENARLFEQEQKQRRRAEALLQIVGAAGSSLSLEQVLINVCRSVVDLTVGERCSVFLFNAESGTLEPIMSLGPEDPVMWEKFRGAAGLRIPDVRDIGIALNVQQPVIEEHAPGSGILPDFWIDTFGIKSLAIYPLVVKDATVGVIAVDSYSDFVRFPPEEVEAMTAIAGQAAVVIEKARLFEQEQRQRQRAEALLQIVSALSSSLSLKNVLIKLCRSVADLSVGDRCSFFLSQEGEERATPIMSLGIEDPSLWEKFKESGALEASQVHGIAESFQSLEPVIEEHVPGSGLLPDYWVDTFNLKSLALYPLVHRDKQVGVMSVDSFRDFVHFPPEEVETMTAIARQAAVVIENARLFEQEQKQRRRAEALLQIVGAASSSLSLKKMLGTLSSSVVDLSVGERCTILLIDKDKGRLVPYMSLGPEDERMWEKFRSLFPTPRTPEMNRLIEGFSGLRAPIIQENVPATRLLPRDWVKSFGIKSMAIYPLAAKEESIGVMAVDSYSDFVHFPAEEIEVLTAIARQASVLIENARLHEQVQQQAIADPLTGLYNHRHLHERLEQEIARAKRSHRPLAVLMLDIDSLKLINDTYGHQVGDEALKLLASALQSSCRAEDIVGRCGGDEFLIILPESDAAEAERIGERVQVNLAARYLESEGKDACVPIRISMGVACYPSDATVMHKLIDVADSALYRSKQRGGSRITTAHGRVEELMPAGSSAFSAMQGLVSALIQKELSMRQHIGSVARYSVLAAAALGLSKKDQNILRRAGWVHDVGKIAVPDGVLRKPGPLNDEEWKLVRQHVDFGVTILRGIAHLADLVPAVAAHHEWFNGGGYPRGLKGRRIPKAARILSVADAYSAMTSDRPYRLAMSREEACAELRRGAGAQFDPQVVEAFVQVLETEARETRAA